MLEPDVTLTDYAIFLECMLFCGLLARPRTRRVDRAAYILLFLLTGLAALTGGTMHGFFAVHSEGPASALWVLTLLLIGGASVALWIAAVKLGRTPWTDAASLSTA